MTQQQQTEYNWQCGSCDTNNKRTALTCYKCRSSRRYARPWECTLCRHPNLGATYECNKCQYDRSGLVKRALQQTASVQ